MVDKADIADAIKSYPREAADALMAVQAGSATPVNLAGLLEGAKLMQRVPEEGAADEIDRRGLSEKFALALKARGVPIVVEALKLEDTHFDDREASLFFSRSETMRCRILIDGRFSGTGCLVGPSLVLTAWHVIADGATKNTDPPRKPIVVQLSDGTKYSAEPQYISPCTDEEIAAAVPNDDAVFKDFNDVALLRLERPEGVRLGFIHLPADVPQMRSGSPILLLHFPAGNNPGAGPGVLAKIRGISARWQHTVLTQPGSSGGACFNNRFVLAGVHQGKFYPNGRFVPLARFLASIRPAIESDVAPPMLWSLDGTPQGPLVIGRDVMFEAIAAAAVPTSRVRGLRVKRFDVGQGTAGLAYSFEMLDRVLRRNPGAHVLIRLAFEPPYRDLLDDIRLRLTQAGLPLPPTAPTAGPAGSTPDVSLNDRMRMLASDTNTAAEQAGKLVWLCFDNPPAGLPDAVRFAFEAAVAAALEQPRLRLVLIGYETISTPGKEFASAGEAAGEGPPGFVVEYFGRFRRSDVEQLLSRACADFGLAPEPAAIATRADQILQGLASTNGEYSTNDLKTVAERAVQHLVYFQDKAKAQS
jgi:hypothetical protein